MKGSVVLGLGALFGLVAACATWDILHVITTKETAFEEAMKRVNEAYEKIMKEKEGEVTHGP